MVYRIWCIYNYYDDIPTYIPTQHSIVNSISSILHKIGNYPQRPTHIRDIAQKSRVREFKIE